jgi:hypothetical protein
MTDRIYLLEGDDHERRAVTAASEDEAREAVADDFNALYRPGEDGDEGTPYDGSEFTLIATYPEGAEIEDELIN